MKIADFVDATIVSRTKSRLAVLFQSSSRGGTHPALLRRDQTSIPSGPRGLRDEIAPQMTERMTTSAVNLPWFYWVIDTHRLKCMRFATETSPRVVARMERSEIRETARRFPGLRCAPSGLREDRGYPGFLAVTIQEA